MNTPEGLTREDLVDQYDAVAKLRDADVEHRLRFAISRLDRAVIHLQAGYSDGPVTSYIAGAHLLAMNDDEFSAFEAEVLAERARNTNLTVERGAA